MENEKLDQIKQYLLAIRNQEVADREEKAIEEDGFFNAQEYSGGNFDDAYQMGKDAGEAELVEGLLAMLEK